MTRTDYLELRNKYVPTEIKTIFILECPPASGQQGNFRIVIRQLLGL